VPATVMMVSPDDPIPDIPLPIMLKPADAVSVSKGRLVKRRSWTCNTRDDLHRAIENWAGKGRYLLQSFIPGRGEGVFGFFADGALHASSGHQRLRMMSPRGSGSSACRSRAPDVATLERTARFLRATEWSGIFMLELLRDSQDRLWFMELNGRTWGSTALARRLGYEYPAWAVHLALDPTFRPHPPEPQPPTTIRHLGRDIVHLLLVIRGPRSNAYRNLWPSRLSTSVSVLSPWSADGFYNRRKGCMGFFIADTLDTIIWNLRKAKF
jgi:predicted ATP-grasp superfamily ATP-dependent carboligase